MIIITAGCVQPSPPQSSRTPPTNVSTASPAPSGTWTFVVFGDSRDNTKDTLTGVSPYTNLIAIAIAAEKPDLVMYTGDLVSGWIISNASPVATDYKVQFKNWMDAVAPIHNYTSGKGTPLYVVRGNHEDGPKQTVMPLLDAYRESAAADMPLNGPPGEERLTYSFTWKGAKFIALDEYFPHNDLKETVNQTWVDQELISDTRPFTFVFGHTPAYLLEDDPEDRGYDLAVHPALRDIFWDSLVKNHVTAYISGHTHLYARGVKDGLQQVVTGNGGAMGHSLNQSAVDPALTIEYPVSEADNTGNDVGYLLVTVNETAGIISAIQNIYQTDTKEWRTGDQFTLSHSGAVISNTNVP
ncbi:MAG: metallophosphoesterase [Methanomicrobiales archaeon]|nr:metallophosphoesterase [Methanomicrobiales archaeon]